jgi:phage repressor protein C with HTH and peptisase S24 domain
MNIKDLREKKNLTQAELSDATGIPRDRIAKWEQGKGSPKAQDYKVLEEFFGNSMEEVPREKKPFIEERREQKMIISTLMVPLVPIKAQAGYISSHELTDFIEKLDKFPMAPGINPRGAEWRWFEVSGESMEPTLYEGDYILCSMVPQEDWRNLENYYLYVIVSVGNMWVKRLVKRKPGEWIMHSDNKKVKQRPVDFAEVREIWKVRRHLNARMPPPERISVEI